MVCRCAAYPFWDSSGTHRRPRQQTLDLRGVLGEEEESKKPLLRHSGAGSQVGEHGEHTAMGLRVRVEPHRHLRTIRRLPARPVGDAAMPIERAGPEPALASAPRRMLDRETSRAPSSPRATARCVRREVLGLHRSGARRRTHGVLELETQALRVEADDRQLPFPHPLPDPPLRATEKPRVCGLSGGGTLREEEESG